MKRIDMATYPRLDHFHYFCSMAYPYVGVTVDVDVTVFKPDRSHIAISTKPSISR